MPENIFEPAMKMSN